jgi:hypothetical protein
VDDTNPLAPAYLNLVSRTDTRVEGIAVPRSFQNDTALKRLEAASQTGLTSAHKHKFREDCNDTPARDRLG